MSAVFLPARDPDPSLRRSQLEAARHAYAYDFRYQGLGFVERLPKAESFDRRYIEQAVKGTLAFDENRFRSTGKRIFDDAKSRVSGLLDRALGRSADEHDETLIEGLRGLSETAAFSTLGEYRKMFVSLPRPASMEVFEEDWAFAWQRIAGAVPCWLRRIDALPAHFPVTEADFRRARPNGGSLVAALREGRIYLADYALFDAIPTGRYPPDRADGVPKYLEAPLALFVADPAAVGSLAPVAIQCGQCPLPGSIVTPSDGARWRLAKAVVQVADGNVEGIVVHFGYCHMILEALIISARRQLSERHPLRVLLDPHFVYTLAANEHARTSLVNPNGTQDRVLAPTLDATLAVLRDTMKEVRLSDLDPRIDAERRGTDDREGLPHHPFRDDGIMLFEAVRRWVAGYVALYYTSAEDVAADVELRAWLDEVGAPDGGRLPRLVEGVSLATPDDVTDLIARIVHRASGYHAAINYNWYDWMGFGPNMPAAGRTSMPGPEVDVNEASLIEFLPPSGLVWETLAQVTTVNAISANRLGDYPKDHFSDPRAAALAARFRSELDEIEREIEVRNASRPLPYTPMLPSRVTASINS